MTNPAEFRIGSNALKGTNPMSESGMKQGRRV